MAPLIDKQVSKKIKRLIFWYNMVPNLFWTGLNLIPISVFCYRIMNPGTFHILLTISLLTVLIPKSFFDHIQLGKTTSVYNKIGVRFINRFTQNGDIINSLIRKKIPQYKVIQARTRSIDYLLKQTYKFEKFHFIVFSFFCLTTIHALANHYFGWAFIISLTNVLYNVYPGLLQQYIRIRLKMLKKRMTK